MKKTYLSFLIVLAFGFLASFKGELPAYTLFAANGKSANWEKLLASCKEADVICFGELHNNVLGHWLELRLLKDLHKDLGAKLSVGAEMWEADDQIVLTEYLNKKITLQHLENEAKLWPNYKTDYKPIFSYAFSKDIPVIATNVPRRYASLVSKRGFVALDSLDAQSKNWMAPLPITVDANLSTYKEMAAMAMHGAPATNNFVNAQALKDATMAHFILKNWQPGSTFLHYNGAFHSQQHEGIVWYLKQKVPTLKVVTISMVEAENIATLPKDAENTADYIFVFPEDAMKSYE